jgi:ribosome maturation factor RimP
MLSSCFHADLAGVLAGHTKMPFTLSTTQSTWGVVCLRAAGACGTWRAENLVYLHGWAAAARPFFVSGPRRKLTQAQQQLEHALEQLIDPICRAHAVDLVDVRYLREPGGAVIRVIIDREVPGVDVGSGVSLEDCTLVSRDVSTALDVHEEILPSGGFRLEVSSPGLERPLVKLSDFERFSGREIKVRTRTAIDRQRRFRGKLLGVVDHSIELDHDGKILQIPHEDIAQANLVYRFSN